MYAHFRIKIAGKSLIMHNGQTANPLNHFSKAMKKLTSNRKKTDADYEKMARIDMHASLYLDEETKTRVVIPSRVLESVLLAGAKTKREGQLAAGGCFVDTDAEFTYEGGPLPVEEILESQAIRFAVPVVVQTARTIRTRPKFSNWTATFEVSLEEAIADERQLQGWIEAAGNLKGIGDWRPRHGRFYVEEFVRLVDVAVRPTTRARIAPNNGADAH